MKMKSLINFSPLPLFIALLTTNHPANAAEVEVTSTSEQDIIWGGMMYDKWWKVLNLKKPTETHPSYPTTGKNSGSSTWRCKECHGWDYKGKEGAYATGSHYSGIIGIRQAETLSNEAVVGILKNKVHQYGSLMPETALQQIASFVTQGQMDMEKWIDSKTKVAQGDAQSGAVLYDTLCVKCHDKENTLYLDQSGDAIGNSFEELVALSNKNPWETLHKIRMSQPASAMPSLFGLEVQQQVDIVRYLQTSLKK